MGRLGPVKLTLMLFSERIRQLRREQGKLQRKLAQQIGVDVPMYCRFEHGERRPKREQVVKLAHAFDVDPAQLVAEWLAEDAYRRIASDREADRATALLCEQLGLTPAAAAPVSPAPVATTPPAEPAPAPAAPAAAPAVTVDRDLPASMGNQMMPLLIKDDALHGLQRIASDTVDCIITTAPYWRNRHSGREGITATTPAQFVDQLLAVMAEAHRVLKPTGSLWLQMGDGRDADGNMLALPQQLVAAMTAQQGWLLRNDIAWMRPGSDPDDDNARRARDTHDHLFHLVKSGDFALDMAALRQAYGLATSKRPAGSTRSGVNGRIYTTRIKRSTVLTDEQKTEALNQLNVIMAQVADGTIIDFRLHLRESQEPLVGDDPLTQALNEHGYHFVINDEYPVPTDVWTLPADRCDIPGYQVTPEALCRILIDATTPAQGLVVDPYCGTGTTCKVAHELGRRSIGIDTNGDYLSRARRRVPQRVLSLFD